MATVTLPEAIEANKNGLGHLKNREGMILKQRSILTDELVALQAEIAARLEMATAMQKVQDLMPKDETIRFLIPRG